MEGRSCKVFVECGAEEIHRGKIMFKSAWTEALMGSSRQQVGDVAYHEVSGELMAVSAELASVLLKGGVMVSVPLNQVCLEWKQS